MANTDLRKGIKIVSSSVAQIGSSILLGAIGSVLITNVKGNALVKVLATIGWFGLSYKISDFAKEGMEDYVDDIYDIVDAIKGEKDVKVLIV